MRKSVKQHFVDELQKGEGARNLIVISFGVICDEEAIATFQRWPHWDALKRIWWQVVKEFGGKDFLGAATCAMLMDYAMKRFLNAHGFKQGIGRGNSSFSHPDANQAKQFRIPPVWEKAIRDLKAMQRLEDRGFNV